MISIGTERNYSNHVQCPAVSCKVHHWLQFGGLHEVKAVHCSDAVYWNLSECFLFLWLSRHCGQLYLHDILVKLVEKILSALVNGLTIRWQSFGLMSLLWRNILVFISRGTELHSGRCCHDQQRKGAGCIYAARNMANQNHRKGRDNRYWCMPIGTLRW